MEEKLVLLCTQVNRKERNVGKDIKVLVLKPVYRRAAAQVRAVYKDHQIPVTLVYYFVFKFLDSQQKISVAL